MGLFDSVFATCPKCGESVEFQSKAGPRDMKRYSANSVPPQIALSLSGDMEACKCGHVLRLVLARKIERVAMVVEEGGSEWD